MKRLSILVLSALVGVMFCSGCNVNDGATSGQTATHQAVTDAAEPSSQAVITPLPTMLELGSEGCKPCEQMKPVMAGLERDYSDQIRIVFHDVRKNPDIARQHGIRLIPTQIFFDADGTEFYRHEGFFARDSIETVFRDHGVAL